MPAKTLWRHKTFPLITFRSPQEAMAAEEILKEVTLSCLVVPTPRELAEGCGLSLRVFPQDVEKCGDALAQRTIQAKFYEWNEKENKWQPFVGAIKVIE
ncbi:DUF3343 domain-containing protein [Heliobacillus mobilis]|uniref:DUF3343 domain-containing protein n=1 Tax=Heliobacterium mobile TaxID=28064 RepID=A0A6I3SGF4_HELMO|nr:DUF3343 domain-containing protein [Heliobacterium mobile]MTV47906.1 DUF3343 domain-containing protein [Heliobacterium mobile]